MKALVIIAFDIEGFHRYEEAPEKVSFLRDTHRHTFKIKIALNVSDLDREKEIFLMRDYFKNRIEKRFGSPAHFGMKSCEMICQHIIIDNPKEPIAWVEVFEEETGGARIEI